MARVLHVLLHDTTPGAVMTNPPLRVDLQSLLNINNKASNTYVEQETRFIMVIVLQGLKHVGGDPLVLPWIIHAMYCILIAIIHSYPPFESGLAITGGA